jgi:hypothetical protein
MPSQSKFQIDIPATDILSYLFPPDKPVSDKPIWIGADDTSNSLSPKQLLLWAVRLGTGLQGLGLKRQDVVMMYSHNHIFVPVAYLGIAGCGCIFSGCNPSYGINGEDFRVYLDASAHDWQRPSIRSRTRSARLFLWNPLFYPHFYKLHRKQNSLQIVYFSSQTRRLELLMESATGDPSYTRRTRSIRSTGNRSLQKNYEILLLH